MHYKTRLVWVPCQPHERSALMILHASGMTDNTAAVMPPQSHKAPAWCRTMHTQRAAMRQGQLRAAVPAQQRVQTPSSVRKQGRCGSQIRAAATVEAEQIKKYIKGIKPKVSCSTRRMVWAWVFLVSTGLSCPRNSHMVPLCGLPSNDSSFSLPGSSG